MPRDAPSTGLRFQLKSAAPPLRVSTLFFLTFPLDLFPVYLCAESQCFDTGGAHWAAVAALRLIGEHYLCALYDAKSSDDTCTSLLFSVNGRRTSLFAGDPIDTGPLELLVCLSVLQHGPCLKSSAVRRQLSSYSTLSEQQQLTPSCLRL